MSEVGVPITFHPNTKDNTHCFQAAFHSILNALMPEKEFSIEKLDRITHKLPGKWTSPTASLLWMAAQDFSVKTIETFDSKKFAEMGERYLFEEHGEEIAKEQIKFSDIDSEQALMRRLVKLDIQEMRVPTINDIDSLIQHGSFVICTINSRVLSNTKGYIGHFVLIKEINIDKNFVIFNDPGLPPIENRRCSIKLFDKAWGYGGDQMKSLIAFGK